MTFARRPLIVSPRYFSAGELIERVRTADHMGVDEIWLEQQPDQRDATVFAAAYLNAVPTVRVGTAVLPVYARHPVSMAQSAASLAEVSGGRYMLGLGFSHQFINEFVLGHKQGPPIRVMREYLSIVRELITTGSVDWDGEVFTAHAQYTSPRLPVPFYLAALRPQMIRLAVEFCDGILLLLCSPRYIREHVMPVVHEACAEFGKSADEFRVLVNLPAYSGSEVADHRAQWAKYVTSYRMLPYYRYVLDINGRHDPEVLSLIGSREEIRDRLCEYRTSGCVPVPQPIGASVDEFAQTVEDCFLD
ncbi:LLM class flavin-dependent oxidoreductase [Actinomadura sp. B10D3]|uniref:LLM class flavin-dependent oxidoreductase n=1 Tax=Actinomadura sp. B10D3 TaxID=3153557 RepID=UPI00325E04C1